MNPEESTKEVAKAVQEVAKTSGQVVGATEKLGKFISKYTHESIDAGLGIFADKLQYMRWERQQRLMKRADAFLKQEGLVGPEKIISFKFAVPLLEAASLEENNELQDLYAKLLVNASNPNSGVDISRSYIDVLERFTPKMFKIFHNIYSTQLTEEKLVNIEGLDLPNTLPEDVNLVMTGGPGVNWQMDWDELDRLRCLRVARKMSNNKINISAKYTFFGLALYRACTLSSELEKI